MKHLKGYSTKAFSISEASEVFDVIRDFCEENNIDIVAEESHIKDRRYESSILIKFRYRQADISIVDTLGIKRLFDVPTHGEYGPYELGEIRVYSFFPMEVEISKGEFKIGYDIYNIMERMKKMGYDVRQYVKMRTFLAFSIFKN